MLLHEGVLIAQGTYNVRWFHDWLREYSLVDLSYRTSNQSDLPR